MPSCAAGRELHLRELIALDAAGALTNDRFAALMASRSASPTSTLHLARGVTKKGGKGRLKPLCFFDKAQKHALFAVVLRRTDQPVNTSAAA